MKEILIQISGDLDEDESAVFENNNIEFYSRKNFDGADSVVEIVAIVSSLSAAAISAWAKVVIEKIRSRKFISLTIDGKEIKGVSEEMIVQLVEKNGINNEKK